MTKKQAGKLAYGARVHHHNTGVVWTVAGTMQEGPGWWSIRLTFQHKTYIDMNHHNCAQFKRGK